MIQATGEGIVRTGSVPQLRLSDEGWKHLSPKPCWKGAPHDTATGRTPGARVRSRFSRPEPGPGIAIVRTPRGPGPPRPGPRRVGWRLLSPRGDAERTGPGAGRVRPGDPRSRAVARTCRRASWPGLHRPGIASGRGTRSLSRPGVQPPPPRAATACHQRLRVPPPAAARPWVARVGARPRPPRSSSVCGPALRGTRTHAFFRRRCVALPFGERVPTPFFVAPWERVPTPFFVPLGYASPRPFSSPRDYTDSATRWAGSPLPPPRGGAAGALFSPSCCFRL